MPSSGFCMRVCSEELVTIVIKSLSHAESSKLHRRVPQHPTTTIKRCKPPVLGRTHLFSGRTEHPTHHPSSRNAQRGHITDHRVHGTCQVEKLWIDESKVCSYWRWSTRLSLTPLRRPGLRPMNMMNMHLWELPYPALSCTFLLQVANQFWHFFAAFTLESESTLRLFIDGSNLI